MQLSFAIIRYGTIHTPFLLPGDSIDKQIVVPVFVVPSKYAPTDDPDTYIACVKAPPVIMMGISEYLLRNVISLVYNPASNPSPNETYPHSYLLRISLYYLVYLKNKKNGGNKVMIKKLILMNFKAGG